MKTWENDETHTDDLVLKSYNDRGTLLNKFPGKGLFILTSGL